MGSTLQYYLKSVSLGHPLGQGRETEFPFEGQGQEEPLAARVQLTGEPAVMSSQ